MLKKLNAWTVLNLSYDNASGAYVDRISDDNKNEYNNNIHFHSFFELEYIISGSGTYEINNIIYPIKPGALFLTTPADYHTYSLRGDETIELYCVQFYPSYVKSTISSKLYSYKEPIVLYQNEINNTVMLERLRELRRIYFDKKLMYDVELYNCIENICINIIRALEESSADTDDQSIIKKAIIYIKNNCREHITLSQVAASVGLSESYFSHLFAKTLGMGLSVYVREMRLDIAASLIQSSELLIKEVCYGSGFRDIGYFSKSFKEKFGVSPAEYRARYHTVAENEDT